MRYRMRVALVCIARDEDRYIDEWINYHFKLGVDTIYIYQDRWEYSGKYKDDSRVILLSFDRSKSSQMSQYNSFIRKYYKDYDWAAFIDVDEFISLRQDADIKSFLNKYENYKAVALNWNMFGTGSVKFDGKNFSCINRFKYCGKKLDHHVKCIIHLALTKNTAGFSTHPHNTDKNNYSISVDKSHFINGPWNEENLYDKSIAVINHYYFKTREEFMHKCKNRSNLNMGWFDKKKHQPNLSEEEDTAAYNFYNEG